MCKLNNGMLAIVIEYQLIEILSSVPLSHRKELVVIVTVFFLWLAVVTFFEIFKKIKHPSFEELTSELLSSEI